MILATAPSAPEAGATRPKLLDMFSGVGGFSLAARWAGYETIGFCEIDPWCRRVLRKHWPEVPIHDDVKTLTGDIVRGWTGGRSVDLLTGGWPCPPVSLAGKRLGEKDVRYLWGEMRRVIADVRPHRVLAENVAGLISMGLDAVLADLEALGYACGAVVVPAAAVGAPHRRDRVWILAERATLADAARIGEREPADQANAVATRRDARQEPRGGSGDVDAADAHRERRREQRSAVADGAQLIGAECAGDAADAEARGIRRGRASGDERQPAFSGEGDVSDAARDLRRTSGDERPVSSEWSSGGESSDGTEALRGMGFQTDGLPRQLAERSGWHSGPAALNPWAGDWESDCPRTQEHETDRVHKLKALGNAIVPAVAYAILDSWGLPDMPEPITPPPAPAPRPTIRRLFSCTKRFPAIVLVLAEAHRQYADIVAIHAHPETVALHGLAGVCEDRRVPKDSLDIEVYA